MNATGTLEMALEKTVIKAKNRNRFEKVLRKCVYSMGIDFLSDVLVVGGSAEDGRTLHKLGFTRVTLSNLLDPRPSEQADLNDAGMRTVRLDAEAMELADNSYDLCYRTRSYITVGLPTKLFSRCFGSVASTSFCLSQTIRLPCRYL